MSLAPRKWSVACALLGAAGAAFGVAQGVGADAEGYRVRRTPVVAAVERAAPAVVNVVTNSGGNWSGGFIRGTGSGVIVHPAGYVVTNSHVVRGANRIWVEVSGAAGGGRLDAGLVEDDPSHDLALLRVSRGSALPYITLAPTSELMVGETAIAIGDPLGLGQTVTVGIVSAVGRTAEMPTGYTIRNLIQTDASINRGNSGGALLNLEGALIGINSSMHPGAQGIAFTVSADDVRAMVERNLGSAPRPSVQPPVVAVVAPLLPASALPPADLPAPQAKKPAGVGLSLKSADGFVVVSAVAPTSPADIGGLKAGDVVLEVDGRPVDGASEVVKAFTSAAPGRAVSLTVFRDGEKKRAIVVSPKS